MNHSPPGEILVPKRSRIGFEDLLICGFGLLLLIAFAVSETTKNGGGTNLRLQYGMQHLPDALLGSFFFTALVAVIRWSLTQLERLPQLRTGYLLMAVIIAFCLFWLPAVLAGGFDRDDWMLLGAASVRKMLVGHPALAWNTLDSVDGNFRPLGTVLYIGIMMRHFGVWARPFLFGLFLVNLLTSLLAFAIVRSLGYSRVAATAGALLYLSRSALYTIVTWTCALGDALVILLCGLMVLALLTTIRRRGWRAATLHLAAWCCFCMAMLAKQSAFAAPLIVSLLLYFRPGTALDLSQRRRLRNAVLGLAIYGATAAVPFLHAKRLLTARSPYPISFSGEALFRVFSYAVWYLGTFEFPTKYKSLHMLPSAIGLILVCAAALLLWRVPTLFGQRPRDVLFCLFAAVASVSLFVVLPARVAPYYGSMASFWVSIALAIALTRFEGTGQPTLHARVCRLVMCVLVLVGFTDVRLKQTGLLPAGGYTWGASEIGMERAAYDSISRELARSPATQTLLIENTPDYDGYFAGMAMTAAPELRRIVTYRSANGTYLVNDRSGIVPLDDAASLRNPGAYNWNVPLNQAEAERLLRQSKVLRLEFHDGKIVRGN